MNKKLLSILLAVLMVAGLCFALIQVSANEGTTAHVLYVKSTGSDSNAGTSEATACKTVTGAIKKAEGLNAKEGDTVTIKVYGTATEGTGQSIFASFNSTTKAAAAPIPVPVEIVGATNDATIAFNTQAATGNSSSSTRRYFGSHTLIFKDLKFTVAGDLNKMMYLSAGTGNVTFDNVSFDSTVTKWRIFADAMVANTWKGTAAARGGTLENKFVINSSITFKNGDYTNLDEVAAIASCATGGSPSNYDTKAPGAYTPGNWTSYPCVINTKVVIGEGAKMDTVHGINWHSFAATGTVDVKDGATVATLIAVGDDCDIASENAITINVEGGAEINSYVEQEGTNVFEGTVAYHSYDNGCDDTCNEAGCNETRTSNDHAYTNACDKDCNNCGEVREVSNHVYDNDDDTTCNVCGSTRYIYYVGGTATDTTQAKGTEANPYANVKEAVDGAATKTGTYNPGDKVEILVTGTVLAEGTTLHHNLLVSGSNTSYKTVRDTEGDLVPVCVKGTGATAEDTVLNFHTTAVNNQASCRKWATVSLHFENLTMGVVGNEGARAYYICLAASFADLSFDNVIFDDSGFTPLPEGATDLVTLGQHNGWVVEGGFINTTVLNANDAARNKGCGGLGILPETVNNTVRFKNGNYENVKVAAVGSQQTNTDYALNGTNGAHVFTSIKTTLIIDDGAHMGNVIGIGQSSKDHDEINVIIRDDPKTSQTTTVATFNGMAKGGCTNTTNKTWSDTLGYDFFGENYNITVEGGATINAFTGLNEYGVLPAGSKLTVWVKNGTIPSFYAVANDHVCANGEVEIIIDDGVFNGGVQTVGRMHTSSYKTPVTTTINGGTFNNSVGARRTNVYTVQSQTMTITGGTFNGIVYPVPMGTVQGDASLTITGGTFKNNVYIAENATVTGNMNLTIGHKATAGQPIPAEVDWPVFKKDVGSCGYNAQNSANDNANTLTASQVTGNVNFDIYYGVFEGSVYVGTNLYMTGTENVTSSMANANMTINGGTFNNSVYGLRKSTVTGDAAITVDGNAHFTHDNSVYLLSGDSTAANVYFTVGHEVTERNPLPAENARPVFDGIVRGGNGCTVTGTLQSTIYYGTFGNFNAGTQGTVGAIDVTVHDGTFGGFATNRTGSTERITVTINGGTFNGNVEGTGQTASSNGVVTITYNGGIFNKLVKSYSAGTATSVTSYVYGGDFYDLYAGSNTTAWGGESGNPVVVKMLLQPKSDVTFRHMMGEAPSGKRVGEADVELRGGAGKLRLYNKVQTLFADSFTGTTPLKIEECEVLSSGKAYIIVAGKHASKIQASSAVGDGTYPLVKEALYTMPDDSKIDATFLIAMFRIKGAGFVLTERISARLYFEPMSTSSYINVLYDLPYTLTVGSYVENGTFADILGQRILLDGVSYYYLELPSMKASDFHKEINFEGFCAEQTFSIAGVAKQGASTYAEQNPKFAKTSAAIYNYVLAACKNDPAHNGCSFRNEAYLEGADADLNKVTGSTSISLKGAKKFSSASGQTGLTMNVKAIARSVSLSDTIAMKYYVHAGKGGANSGSYAVKPDLFKLKINGVEVDKTLYQFEEMNSTVNLTAPNGQTWAANYSFTLYINARFLVDDYTLEIYYDESACLASITDGVALICKQYANAYSGNSVGEVAQKTIAYAQAVRSYNNQLNTSVILNERRETVYQAMLESMGGILWTPTEDVDYYVNILPNDDGGSVDSDLGGEVTNDAEAANNHIYLKAGTIYCGLPYTHGSGSMAAFQSVGTQDSKGVWHLNLTDALIGKSTNSSSRLGNDCADAVFWAWATVSNTISFNGTQAMTDVSNVVKVGNYKTSSDRLHRNTTAVCEENGREVMYRAYAQLRKGDGLVRVLRTANGGASGHALFVKSVEFKFNADGSIDYANSIIHCMEQSRLYLGKINQSTATKYYDANLGKYVYQVGIPDLPITFSKAFDSAYLPITCLELLDPTAGLEKVTVTDSVNQRTAENLFTGTITSNYIISHTKIIVENAKGKTVQDITLFSRESSRKKLDLTTVASELAIGATHSDTAPVDLASLASGTYTCRAEVYSATGEVLEAFRFTVQK